jgi:hypothetical protein
VRREPSLAAVVEEHRAERAGRPVLVDVLAVALVTADVHVGGLTQAAARP